MDEGRLRGGVDWEICCRASLLAALFFAGAGMCFAAFSTLWLGTACYAIASFWMGLRGWFAEEWRRDLGETDP